MPMDFIDISWKFGKNIVLRRHGRVSISMKLTFAYKDMFAYKNSAQNGLLAWALGEEQTHKRLGTKDWFFLVHK